MKLSLEEQETIIRYDRATKEATVYTHEPALKRKLADIAESCAGVVLVACDDGSVEYTIPKKLITIRKPQKKRTLSADEKQSIADRLSQRRNEV